MVLTALDVLDPQQEKRSLGGAHARRKAEAAAAADSRAGLSDRRLHRRTPGDRAGLHDRARLDHDAREVGDRDEQETRSRLARPHRHSIPGYTARAHLT